MCVLNEGTDYQFRLRDPAFDLYILDCGRMIRKLLITLYGPDR